MDWLFWLILLLVFGIAGLLFYELRDKKLGVKEKVKTGVLFSLIIVIAVSWLIIRGISNNEYVVVKEDLTKQPVNYIDIPEGYKLEVKTAEDGSIVQTLVPLDKADIFSIWYVENQFNNLPLAEQTLRVNKGYFYSCAMVKTFCQNHPAEVGCLKYCEGKY